MGGENARVVCDGRGFNLGGVAPTLAGDHANRVGDHAQAVITLDRAAFNQGANAKYNFDIDDNGIAQTIVARGPGAVCDIRKLLPVRRFTPTECARLQGMPSWWCADIPHSDTSEYKMWGNGMALPNALYVMEGIAEARLKELHGGER